MKKIILNVLFVFGITAFASAQAYDAVPMAVTPANMPQNNAFYNAAQNAYANEVYKSYWVWDNSSVSWVKRVELVTPAPVAPAAKPIPLFNLPYYGNDVCLNNTCSIKTKVQTAGQ